MDDELKDRESSCSPLDESKPSAGRSALTELLDEPLARREPPPGQNCLVGECVETEHPTLQGRVRVRTRDAAGSERTSWVPKLQGLPVRAGDRVLLMHPLNLERWSDGWIVTGVVDGLADRPRVDKRPRARLELERDEALQIVSRDGQPLVEVSYNDAGPLVRLLERDTRVEFAGKLQFAAEQIELEATRGQVSIKASDDVVVRGEVVRLN